MKIVWIHHLSSPFLFLLLLLLIPTESVFHCRNLVGSIGEDSEDINCRIRPNISLRSGLGCTIRCTSTNSTACYSLNTGELVCGREFFQFSAYLSARLEVEYGVFPGSGLIDGYLTRYSTMTRQCLPTQRTCGCRVMVAGRPCACHPESDVQIETRCPFFEDGLEEMQRAPNNAAKTVAGDDSGLAAKFDKVYKAMEAMVKKAP